MKSFKAYLLSFFISLVAILSCKDPEIAFPEGGYEYPKNVEDKDTTFYCYPLKDIQSTKDSFETANSYFFLQDFNEYNLSLKPNNNPIIRLTYFGNPTAIIALLPDQIVVKEYISGTWYHLPDTTKLSAKERFHFDILQRFFPLNDTNYKKWKKIYLDSLSIIYPELLDPNYYKYLLQKSGVASDKFEYSSKKIPIKKKTFAYLVEQINESGYWQLPFDNWCKDVPTDAFAFILEANTPNRYNVVKSISCPDDTTRYVKACQELLNYAGMGEEIELIWSGATTTEEPINVRELRLIEVKEETKQKAKKAK